MAETTARPTVAELVDVFVSAPSDLLDAEFHELAGALWDNRVATDLAVPTTAEIVRRFGQADDEHKGHLAMLLGLLIETELPAIDGPIATAALAGVDEYLSLWRGTNKGEPLSLALHYLLAHFPDARERILAVATELDLDVDDYSRLERSVRKLDRANPDVGRAFPSPVAWEMNEEERDYDQKVVNTMSPTEVEASWNRDTETVLGNTGAKAYWAVRHGSVPSIVPEAEVPPRNPKPKDADVGIFARHAAVFRCPQCSSGTFTFRADAAHCDNCSGEYAISRGMLDLSNTASDTFDRDQFLFNLAKMSSLGYFVEQFARPNFKRLCGFAWDGEVQPEIEFSYIRSSVRPVDGPVLDIAAGPGGWTKILVEKFGPERVIALDLAAPMLMTLRDRLPETPAVIKNATSLPFADESMGAVMCWNGPQAFVDVAHEVIAEIGRVLKPGGTFTTYTFANSADPIYRYYMGLHHLPQPAGGLRVFDMDEFKGWLADAGLEIVEESGPSLAAFITAEKKH